MFWTRLIVSLVEFVLSVVLSLFVIFWSYTSFKGMMDYDVEAELKNRNVAVAILLTALMVSTSLMMHETVYPVTSIVTIYLTSPSESGIGFLRLLAYCVGHLLLGFLLSLATIELALRLFEKLTTGFNEEDEVRKGNAAVAIVMAGVVIVTALYLQQGLGGLTKTLIPQPSLGSIRVLQ